MDKTIKYISNKYQVDELDVEKAIERIKSNESLLFAMSGKMAAGKDTIGHEIPNHKDMKKYSFVNTSYSKSIKEEIDELMTDYHNNLPLKQLSDKYDVKNDYIIQLSDILNGDSIYTRTDNTRKASQYWATDIRRKQDWNYWINKMVQYIIKEINKGNSIYITDLRFSNEAKSIANLNGKVIRLIAPEPVRAGRLLSRDGLTPTNEQLNHYSELELDNYDFDMNFDGCQTPNVIVDQVVKYILS